MRVRFLELAQAEFDDAIRYYDRQQEGLGRRFRHTVRGTIERITRFPSAHPPLSANTRRCLISRFPYGIIYRHRKIDNEILIIAVAHVRRQPNYWVDRMLRR